MNGQYKHKMEINNFIRQVMEGAKPSELEGILYYQDQIAEVAKLVAEHEREACAMTCIDISHKWTRMGAWGQNTEYHECADAIRARGQA